MSYVRYVMWFFLIFLHLYPLNSSETVQLFLFYHLEGLIVGLSHVPDVFFHFSSVSVYMFNCVRNMILIFYCYAQISYKYSPNRRMWRTGAQYVDYWRRRGYPTWIPLDGSSILWTRIRQYLLLWWYFGNVYGYTIFESICLKTWYFIDFWWMGDDSRSLRCWSHQHESLLRSS